VVHRERLPVDVDLDRHVDVHVVEHDDASAQVTGGVQARVRGDGSRQRGCDVDGQRDRALCSQPRQHVGDVGAEPRRDRVPTARGGADVDDHGTHR
jgi:hypothetical protein